MTLGAFLVNMINFWLINPFYVTGFFLYHLKISENHRISDFFQGGIERD